MSFPPCHGPGQASTSLLIFKKENKPHYAIMMSMDSNFVIFPRFPMVLAAIVISPCKDMGKVYIGVPG